MQRQPSSGVDRLAIFSFLWAAAIVAHHAASPKWFGRYGLVNVALMGAALFVLVRPRSIPGFAALAALGLLNVFKQAPFHPNHILFGGFVCAILLAALILQRLQHAAVLLSESERRDALFDSFAAPLRIAYILLFGFAFLHKLNSDFLTADVSCAVVVADTSFTQYGMPPLPEWLAEPVIWGAVGIEAAVAIGLVFTRTRFFAVVLALLFHLFLALYRPVPLYSFAAEMFALLFLFTPASFADTVSRTLTELGQVPRRPRVRAAGALAACAAIVLLFDADGRLLLWNVWAWFLVAVFVRCCRHYPGSFRIDGAFRVRPRILWIFLALLTLNGVSPYLGLKTQTSFSMYSNLRTEGGRANHLFLGRLDLAGWQDDLVEILDSDLPTFAAARDDDVLLPYFEFRRAVGSADRDFRVEYRRRGEVHVLVVRDGGASGPAVTRLPWWLGKLIRFRPVQREGPTQCRH